jgi:hypothetical protein
VVGYLSRFGRNTAELMLNVQRLDELGATLYVGGDSPMIVTPGIRGTSKMLLTVLERRRRDAGRRARGRAQVRERDRDRRRRVDPRCPTATGAATALAARSSTTTISVTGPRPRRGAAHLRHARDAWAQLQGSHERLNDEHVLTPTALRYERREREKPGAPLWKPNTVANLVAVHTYRGVIPRATQWSDTGKRKPIAWDLLPGRHEALVSERTWKAAQANGAPVVRNGGNGDAVLLGARALLVVLAHAETVASQVAHLQASRQHCGLPLHAHVRLPAQGLPAPRADHALACRQARARAAARGAHRRARAAWRRRARPRAQGAEAELVAMSEDYDTFLSRAGVIPAERFARANAEYLQRLATAEGRVAVLKGRVTPDELDALRNFDAIELDGQRAVFARLLDAVVVLPAPGAGRSGVVAERVVLVPKGTAPFELSGTGRVVAARPWPL